MAELRAPTEEDLDAVYAIVAARDVADLGVVDYQPGDLRDEWAESAFDLARDARVALDAGGAVVGYGDLRPQGAQVFVHPEHGDPAALAALQDFVEARARAQGRAEFRQLTAARNRACAEELERRGYTLARHYRRLGRSLDGLIGAGPPAVPEGLALRSIVPEADAAALWRLDDDSFRGAPDFTPHTETAFREEHLATHDFAPELSLVARRDGAPVGYLVARRFEREQTGFVDLLGVHPSERGAGLGSALLRTALHGFARAGLRFGDLMVATDNPRALALYERAGLRERWRFDAYHRRAGNS